MESDSKKAADAIREQVLKDDPNEGRLIALKFTVDGEVPILRKNGADVETPLPEEEFRGVPEGWKSKHSETMWKLHECFEQVRSMPRRQIPLLRDEATGVGISKSLLKDLEAFGMIRHRLLKVLDKRLGGKPVGGRMVVYFTPQGHAYVREALKERKTDVQAVPSADSPSQPSPG